MTQCIMVFSICCGGEKTLNTEGKKTVMDFICCKMAPIRKKRIKHSRKTEGIQGDYLACADGAWLSATGHSGPMPTQCSDILKTLPNLQRSASGTSLIGVKSSHSRLMLPWLRMTCLIKFAFVSSTNYVIVIEFTVVPWVQQA